jgi:hypothetical protein
MDSDLGYCTGWVYARARVILLGIVTVVHAVFVRFETFAKRADIIVTDRIDFAIQKDRSLV